MYGLFLQSKYTTLHTKYERGTWSYAKKKQRMNEGGKHSSAFMCQVVLLLRQVTDGLLCRKTDEGLQLCVFSKEWIIIFRLLNQVK